jgi:hypothetical protein
MRKVLYVNLSGGLGNQLFMFASALALSVKWKQELVLVDKWYVGEQRGAAFSEFRRKFDLAEIEPISKNFRLANKWETGLIRCIEWIHFKNKVNLRFLGLFDADIKSLEGIAERQKYLYGYTQNPAFFENLRGYLLELIKLPDDQKERVEKIIERYHKNYERIIAIHVRRGDYAHPDSFGCLLTADYFKNALRHFNLEKSKVLIFSDSPDWCRNNSFLGQFEVIAEPSAAISLVLMSQCDDFVISPSTFSWWGAWLSTTQDKIIVAPKPYNEFDGDVWEQFVQYGWIREKSIFEKP